MNKVSYIFFGSSQMSVHALDELKRLGMLPYLIVTSEDKPVGRKQILTPNVVKQWAVENKIDFLNPSKLDASFALELKAKNTSAQGKEICPIFLVASFGRIIPAKILEMPSKGTLNIHPSLLPKYRGPSPLPTTILEDAKHTGVTIIQLDNEMDHGPIVATKEVEIKEWPVYEKFEEMMAKQGALLFFEISGPWLRGEITAKEQEHALASYTKKITKEDGLLNLSDDPYLNFRKIQAYHQWPQAYFLHEYNGRKIRVKITEASFSGGKLEILNLIPEGKKEMTYSAFKSGYGEIISD